MTNHKNKCSTLQRTIQKPQQASNDTRQTARGVQLPVSLYEQYSMYWTVCTLGAAASLAFIQHAYQLFQTLNLMCYFIGCPKISNQNLGKVVKQHLLRSKWNCEITLSRQNKCGDQFICCFYLFTCIHCFFFLAQLEGRGNTLWTQHCLDVAF